MQTRASFILIFLFIMLSPMRVSSQIVTGAEQMDQYMPLLKGKRIGMVVNHTSVVGAKRVHLLDTLLRRDVRVVKAFAPEHGQRFRRRPLQTRSRITTYSTDCAELRR